MNCGKILVLTALVVWCAGCGGDKKFGSSNDDTFVDLRVEQGVEITYDGNANDKADLVDNDITSIWTDPSTGLMWQRHALPDRRTQASAKQYCQALTLAGYSDWQLPTVQELRTIQGCPATATEGPCRMDVLLGLSEDVCWHGGGV